MLEKGKQLHAKLTLKLPLFEGFEGNVSFRPYPHASLTRCGSRTTEKTKMGLFEQVTLSLGILKKRPLYW